MAKLSFLAVLLLLIVVTTTTTNAFVPASKSSNLSLRSSTTTTPSPASVSSSTTSLSERQWNFNEGRSPWGLKNNAEIWNGRVAQMAFVWVFLQELITGKGIFKGLEERDPFFIANAVAFGVCVVGLTGWLALKGSEDYTKE